MRRFAFLVLCGCFICAPTILAGASGEEVVVVYNSRMRQSREVAEYYAAKRFVPQRQILGLSLPTDDAITRSDYRDKLEKRLLKFLEQRSLWTLQPLPNSRHANSRNDRHVVSSRVRYLVLCYGVPFKIAPDPTLQEAPLQPVPPELRRNEAAVDNELAALSRYYSAAIGFLPNPAYAATNTYALHPTNGVLLVARLDGPSAQIAKGLVDKAISAETDGLWGRAYFDLRNTSDPIFKPGDDSLRMAAEICRRLGYETIVDEQSRTFPVDFPLPQVALYAGWYDEHVSGPFAHPTVEFMPGAFAYHLHSFSAARLRDPQLNWVGPFLARGATISMGTVWEPFLAGTPDVAIFCERFLNRGFTFGEAAYAAQAVLSWQTTVVGDPLYAPAAKAPQDLHADLERRQSASLEWSLLKLVDLNRVNGKPEHELVRFLEALELRKTSAVLTERLGDLYASQGKPSSASHMYEQALSLNPSPQQREQLMLKAQALR